MGDGQGDGIGSADAPDAVIDAFMSYSRRDGSVVLPLAERLEALGRAVWIDTTDIAPGAPWRSELAAAIEGAHAVICCLSPSWLTSAECRREYAQAQSLGKRLIPVLVADLEDSEVPDGLRVVQYADARTPARLDQAAAAVARAIDVDAARVHEHTHFLSLASRWEAGGRHPSFLLRGRELEAAESWLALGGSWPSPVPAQVELVRESRRGETRRRRRLSVASAVAVLVSLALAAVALFQRAEAVRERDEAQRQQRTAVARSLVSLAETVRTDDPRRALRYQLAARALRPEPQQVAAVVETLMSTDLQSTFVGHDAPVTAVAVSPDGQVLASGDSSGVLLVRDLEPDDLPSVPTHRLEVAADISSVVFSPVGDELAVAGEGSGVQIWSWDVAGARPISVVAGDARGAVYAPDGGSLIVGRSDGSLEVYSVPRYERVVTVPDGGSRPAVSDDGTTVATLTADGVTLWDLTTPETPTRITDIAHDLPGDKAAVAFGPGGAVLGTGDSNGIVELWDLTDVRAPVQISVEYSGANWVNAIAFSPDGGYMTAGNDDGAAPLWDLRAPGEPVAVVERYVHRVDDLASTAGSLRQAVNEVLATVFSTDGRLLVTGAGDGTVSVWRVADRLRPGLVGHETQMHQGPAELAAAGGPGYFLTGSGQARDVALWDVADDGTPTLLDRLSPVTSAAVARRVDVAALVAVDGLVELWDVSATVDLRRNGERILVEDSRTKEVVLAPDASRLAVVDFYGGVTLWDVSDADEPVRIGRTFAVAEDTTSFSATFSPDASMIAVGDSTGRTTLWDVSGDVTPSRIGDPLPKHGESDVHDLEFTSDGDLLAAAGDDGTIRLWEVADPERPRLATPPIVAHDHVVLSLDIATGDRMLASGDLRGRVRLWSIADAAAPHALGEVLVSDCPQVLAVAFSRDASLLTATDACGGGTVWDVTGAAEAMDEPFARACRIVGRELSAGEWADVAGDLGPLSTCDDRP